MFLTGEVKDLTTLGYSPGPPPSRTLRIKERKQWLSLATMTMLGIGQPGTPELPRLHRQTASELLDGNDEDRSIAMHILKVQLGLSEDEIQAIQAARGRRPAPTQLTSSGSAPTKWMPAITPRLSPTSTAPSRWPRTTRRPTTAGASLKMDRETTPAPLPTLTAPSRWPRTTETSTTTGA